MFHEFTSKDGVRFLIDFASGWEVFDRGDKPAYWDNPIQARNLNCREAYNEVREKLLTQSKFPWYHDSSTT